MECTKVNMNFKVIGVKGISKYADFGSEVPKLAQEFLTRRGEIQNSTNTEIALYEPKKDKDDEEGQYFVGLILNEYPEVIPPRMEYREESGDYVTVRGNMKEIETLHHRLSQWSEEHGYKRDLGSKIVEVYHPLAYGEEEVEVYLPVV